MMLREIARHAVANGCVYLWCRALELWDGIKLLITLCSALLLHILKYGDYIR